MTALAITSSVMALGIAEVVLRLLSDGESTSSFRALFVDDPVIGYRPRPGARLRVVTDEYDTEVRINDAGVRDDRELPPKPPGEQRIVVLGDSMVMAVQVDHADTFTSLLEARLGNRTGRRIRVINAGVQGYGPVEQLLLFQQSAATFDPDLVLIVVHSGNDATDAASAEYRLVRAGADAGHRPGQMVEPSNGRFGIPLWIRRLARRSAAIQMVRSRLLAVLGPSARTPIRDRPIDSYLTTLPADVERGFAVARDSVRHIVDFSRANGARVAIVVLPAAFELNAEWFDALSREYQRRDTTPLDRHGATNRFVPLLSSLGVPLLNLLPVLQSVPSPASLFFSGNSHLQPRGHVVVADALAEFIRTRDLLDSSTGVNSSRR